MFKNSQIKQFLNKTQSVEFGIVMAIKKEFYDKLENWFSSSESFALDTNTLIELVKEGKFSILNRLTLAKNYVLTPRIASDLIGLCHDSILNQMQIRQIQSFVATCKRTGRLSRIDSKAIEKKLAPLASLLPRKIVIDVVVGRDDDKTSFVNMLVEKYNNLLEFMKEKKAIIDYRELSREYNVEKSKLLYKCIKKLDDNLFMNQLVLKEEKRQLFETEIERLLEQTVKFVEGIISSALKEKRGVKETLNKIKLELMRYSTKKYTGDIQAVSQAIANGATFSSFDSDVIFLMTLYSAANAA